MISTNQSTCAFLDDLLSRYGRLSTSTPHPELSELKSTNAAPTTFQAAELKGSIELLDNPITEIQKEIDLHKIVIVSLETEMAQLKDIKREYQTALSPIHRLPPSILAEILRWMPKDDIEPFDTPYDYGSHHDHGFNVFKISEGPWYLGQVCTSWRNAVQFSCPEIWLRLKIACPVKRSEEGGRIVPTPKKDMLALLDRALERSRNHRLENFFTCSWCGMEDEIEVPEEMIRCFDLLLRHSERWRAVEFEIVPSFLSRLSTVQGRVSQLQDVFLTCEPDAMPGTVRVFKIAPKLRTMNLVGMHAESDILLPKENLMFFSDGRPHPAHDMVPKYLNDIASAPNLLEFSHYHYSSTVPASLGPSHPRVVHQSLKTLSTALGGLIDSLVLPGIFEITLPSSDRVGNATMCPRDTLSHLQFGRSLWMFPDYT